MKCPFLVKRKPIFDKDGKMVGEDIEAQNCIKNDCMVYDSAIKLCSLLSSNMKTGILIEDFKAGIKELREEMFQRAEATGIVMSTTVQTMQDAMLGRFDIIKKQNEVIALGFDRLFELGNSIYQIIKESSDKISGTVTTLQDSLENQGTGLKSTMTNLQNTAQNIAQVQTSFTDELKKMFNEYGRQIDKMNQDLTGKTGLLKNDLEKLTAINQSGMEVISNTIDKASLTVQDILRKIELLDVLASSSSNLGEVIKNEMSGMKSEGMNLIGSIAVKFDELGKMLGDNAHVQDEKLKDMIAKIEYIGEVLKAELTGVKTDGLTALTELKSGSLDVLSDIKSELKLIKSENAASAGVLSSGLDGMKADSLAILGEVKSEVSSFKSEGLGALHSIKDGIESAQSDNKEMKGELKSELVKYFEAITTEMINFNNDTKTALTGLQGSFGKFEEVFSQIETNLNNVTSAMREMNHNYLESLGKIASLAESMRQGVEKIGDGMTLKFDEVGQAIKNEIIAAKNQTSAPIAEIKGSMTKFEEMFGESRTSLVDMSTMMNNLNHNYLESLSKIAGLAEGMRKGVDKVGEGMQESVKDLVGEMKKEIGALEKQYEVTFKDIARLTEKFGELNSRLDKMTHEVQRDFKESFERQAQLSDFTKDILKNIKDYFDKEDARYKEERVLQLKKEGIDHFDRSTLYFYRGKYELALNEIEKALEIDKTAEYLNLKGLVLTDLGRQDEAKKVFWEALKIEPNMSEIYNNLGVLYLKMKKLDDAVAAFEDALKRNINYARAYVHLGKAFVEMEKYDEAMKAFEHALQIDPGIREAQEAIAMYREGKVG